MIRITVEGARVEGLSRRVLTKLRPAARNRVAEDLVWFKRELENEMRRPKTGRLYRRRGKIHQASAPGEAPAVDTGALLNSLYISPISWRNWTVSGYVGSRLPRSRWLEDGTSRIAPRPGWRIVMRRLQRHSRGRKFRPTISRTI